MTIRLHTILAVEPDRKGAANKILAETRNTFSKKQDHFFGQVRTYFPLREGDLETFEPEVKEIVTTVKAKLDHTQKALIEQLDLLYQKEQANTHAKADLVIDDVVVAKDVPATVLLNFEHKFKEIRAMYDEIPTLPPDEVWKKDDSKADVYKTETKTSYKSKKETKPVILYPATDRHPAQITPVVEDIRIGSWELVRYAGCLSPLEKSIFLGRIDKVIQALKMARSKANEAEVEPVKMASFLFDYINNG